MLGNFGCSPQSSELDTLRKEKFCALIPSTQFTNITTCSPQGTRCVDNIWVSRSLQKIYSGTCTVVFGQLHRLRLKSSLRLVVLIRSGFILRKIICEFIQHSSYLKLFSSAQFYSCFINSGQKSAKFTLQVHLRIFEYHGIVVFFFFVI